MLSVLTVILLLLAITVLLVLFAAIDVVFEVKGSGISVEHNVAVHWLFFSRQVSPAEDNEIHEEKGHGDPEDVKDAEKFVTEKVTGYFETSKGKKRDKKKKRSVDMSFSEIIQAFRQLRSPVIRMLKGLIHAIKIPYARINAVYGFPDPAYTGVACGYSHALKGYLACNFENLKLQLEPDFTDSRMDLDISGKVSIRLYRLIAVVILFILNWSVIRFSWNFFIKKKLKKPDIDF